MVAFNVSGSWFLLNTACNVADFLVSDLADDASPLISYSPAGAWTDSPYNDLSAPVRSVRNDVFAFTR
jgi:hypothetical protein